MDHYLMLFKFAWISAESANEPFALLDFLEDVLQTTTDLMIQGPVLRRKIVLAFRLSFIISHSTSIYHHRENLIMEVDREAHFHNIS
jgi:hypothetical protein